MLKNEKGREGGGEINEERGPEEQASKSEAQANLSPTLLGAPPLPGISSHWPYFHSAPASLDPTGLTSPFGAQVQVWNKSP